MTRKTPQKKSSHPHEMRVISYNIHQGKTARRQKLSLELLKEAIKGLDADLVLLQEVAGSNKPTGGPADIERAYQLEALADEMWPHFAYQKNSLFSGGYHGNAILSRFPIVKWHHLNVTVPGMKKRGVLHGEIAVPGYRNHLHVMAAHLGLLQYERHQQTRKLCHYVAAHIPHSERVILGGDFNDWREHVSKRVEKELSMKEAFLSQDARHARTFPSRMPMLPLDRIYYRGLKLKSAHILKGRPWSQLSDHLPVLGHFTIGSHSENDKED